MTGSARGPERGAGPRRFRGDDGDTLLEILLTVAVVSITAISLLTAFATAIGASARHKTLSANSVALRDVSEVVFAQIQQQVTYLSCATPSNYTSVSNWGAPSGYTATITTVQYWTSSGWSSSCTTGSTAPQLLNAQVTSPTGVQATTQLVVAAANSTGSGSSVSVVTASPSVLSQGRSNQTVTLTGSGFESGAVATFSGSGVTVNSTTFVSATSLTLNVSVASNATEGLRTITVTNPDNSTATSGLIFDVAGQVTQFLVTPSSSSVMAGTAFTVTLAAEDASAQLVPSYSGTVNIIWSGGSTSAGGNAPSYPTQTVTFFNGQSTTTLSATLYGAGANNLTATSGAASGYATVTITAGTASGYRVSGPSSATAGTQFSGVTLSIVDAYGNAVTSSSPTCTMTFSGASASPGGNAPTYPNGSVVFSNGVSTTTLKFTLYAAETASLKASSGTGGNCPSSTVVAASVAVRAATGTKLAWSGYTYNACTDPVSGNPTANTLTLNSCGKKTALTVTGSVSLVDNYGNLATAASQFTVTLTATGATVSPATLTFLAGSTTATGTFTYNVTFSSGNGSQAFTFTASGGGYTTATATFNK